MNENGSTLETATPTEAVMGIDIGGTSIKMGLVTERGTVLAAGSVRTGVIDGPAAFEKVTRAAGELVAQGGMAKGGIRAIGLDVPGVVLEDGTLTMAPNITLDLAGLVAVLRETYPQARIAVLNDANAAALGEAWLGSGNATGGTVMVTLGTGVGAGVVIGGNVIAGAHGAAGEIGHLNVEPNETEACNCGCHGCLEQYASARGLIRLYLEECEADGAERVEIAHATDALAVFEAARSGNAQATHACERLGRYLARALAAVAVTVDPDAFVVGGGMSGGWDTFGQTCLDHYRKVAVSACKNTPIRPASLGNDAGFLGAARKAILSL